MPTRPSLLLPALYGGVIIGVISAVPGLSLLNCFCCAGIMLGGFFAVFFFKKDLSPDMPAVSSSEGLKLGALAGVIGAVISLVLSRLVMMMMGSADAEIVKGMIDSLGLSSQLPPGTMDQIEQSMASPVGFFQVVVTFILNPLFGLIGGLIGYSVFKGKAVASPPAVPPPAQQG